ncbi:Crp/Fnr family transcriptional regulator [Olivibacter sp. SDN3]|uniref:Crp/Fnr family transcriptional regulator n=1 Tax=Olivibacter sp. SDN3 TaxID=2764720 RepID=UPI001650E78E|nr:Crp/Fnr family transcriptional regulator [Olivibacter sp. SDN3]QNL49593.1 Crp/Fnr family transcriptional regulator [Olivibacter sp. SDN3]
MDFYAQLLDHIRRHITLTPREEEQIRASFQVKRLPKRAFLLQEGNFSFYENYVVKGCLYSYALDDQGNKHILHLAIEDWWINDFESFLKEIPASRYIVALEDAIILQINKENLTSLLKHIPAFNHFFLVLHQNGTIAQDRRILHNIQLSGAERYEWFVKHYPFFVERIPQKYIASYLGITPEFLSSIRKRAGRKNKSS